MCVCVYISLLYSCIYFLTERDPWNCPWRDETFPY